MWMRPYYKVFKRTHIPGSYCNLQPIYKLLTKALHFVDEEKLESGYAKTRKDKIYLQRAACFFIESDYQAADIDSTESLKLKLSTKVGISRVRTGCTSRESYCT